MRKTDSDDNQSNEFEQFVKNTKQIVAKSNFIDFELKLFAKEEMINFYTKQSLAKE